MYKGYNSLGYHGDSFVSQRRPTGTNINGKKTKTGAGLTPEEKEALIHCVYSWKRDGKENDGKEVKT